jgi:hypothetical protein
MCLKMVRARRAVPEKKMYPPAAGLRFFVGARRCLAQEDYRKSGLRPAVYKTFGPSSGRFFHPLCLPILRRHYEKNHHP